MKKCIKYLLLILLALLLINCSNNSESSADVELWPEIEPYESGYLKVSDIHEIYYEQCGNPQGKPVFVIHGGPGVGCSPSYRRFFNPDKFNIILHDQRGAGKSKPSAELEENTTQLLVEDIEQLRKELNIDKIILFGGSWGSTLSLAYAETYPEHVNGLVVRGIWFPTKEDEDFWIRIVPKYFPKEYDALINAFPDSLLPPNGQNLVKILKGNNISKRNMMAKLVLRYEDKAAGLNIKDEELDDYYNTDENIEEIYRIALIENYYASNCCFLEEGQILRDAYKIESIPTIIINGRYDMFCPPVNAYNLHKQLNNSKLIIAEKAGHSASEKPIEKELLLAMREFE